MSQLRLTGPGRGGDLKKLEGYLYRLTEQLRYVLSNLGEENLSPQLAEQLTEAAAAGALSRRVAGQLGAYSTIVQTGQLIGAAVGAVDGRVSSLAVTADGLAARVEDAEGRVSQVAQTASSLTSTVSGLNGRVSVLEQTAGGVAVELRDTVAGTAFSAQFGQMPLFGVPSLLFRENGVLKGGICYGGAGDNDFTLCGIGKTFVGGANGLAGFVFEADAYAPGGELAQANAHLAPTTGASGSYSLGTRGSLGTRLWKDVNISGSVDNASDRRLKREIGDLDAAALLKRLRPRRFKMKADGQGGKWRWGFIAQEVGEALAALGLEGVQLLDEEDPGSLGLCYMELIALLVEGWQQHQREIARQQARIEALEARLCRLEEDSR